MANYKGSREAAACAMRERAAKDKRILFISPDSLKAMRATDFAAEYPDRCVEVGIAEQQAVAAACGLASTGLIPVVGTYGGFLSMRACEQVRTFIAYPRLNVKLIGINGGIYGGEREGVTHQAFEDLGILRSIPGITLLTPADENQVYQAAKAMFDIDGPVYLRCASGKERIAYEDPDTPFLFGKNRVVKDYGTDAVIFCSGFLMPRAMEAAERLKAEGVLVTLADVSTLKPLDREGTAEQLKRCGAAVTVEDHNIIGGLRSAVAELAACETPAYVIPVGLKDIFPSSGAAEEAADFYGMSVKDIMEAAREAKRRKKG
ncbi:MAG: transketolase [Lachnospiraceae bacterium]|nr:transketolase [Lachnospiraceae bacterium]